MPLSHRAQTHNTEEIIEYFFIRVKNEKKGLDSAAPRHFASILFYNALINLSVKLPEMWGRGEKAI